MAPAAKSKPAANGKPQKSSAPSTDGNTTPVPDAAKDGAASTGGASKPDKAAYDAEQDQLKKDIDALQVKLSAVREKIGSGTKGGPADDKRTKLRSELDGLRSQQASGKQSRGKLLDQLKALNEGVTRKIKDLNVAKGKIPYKSVEEVDERIKQLDKQIESGSMKLADEKRALQEISQVRRSRRTVESFQKEQSSIEADRAAADAVRAQLDDPEAKAISERYDTIKAELDALKAESDVIYANRNKLFDERNALQGELDVVYNRKRESATRFRESNDRYWQKVNEDRARRAERTRAQRAEEETEKKREHAERIREDASAPAFQAQIEDCQTLIDYFSGKTSAPAVVAALAPRSDVVGVPKLEPRTVEQKDDFVPLKKKGESEEDYFAGKAKGKKGGKKGGPKPTAAAATEEVASSSDKVNVPFGTLSALLSLSIPPPASSADRPRVVEDLKTKKAWFEANQKRVTEENVAKAEKEIARLTGGSANGTAPAPAPVDDVTPPNGGGEKPAEPTHTPAVSDTISVPVPSEEVIEQLETVKEAEA